MVTLKRLQIIVVKFISNKDNNDKFTKLYNNIEYSNKVSVEEYLKKLVNNVLYKNYFFNINS